METKQISGELAVKLLWDLANALPAENHTNKLLRSYYLTTCKKIGRRDVKLPAAKFAPSVMCPKCASIWSESKFSLYLKPQRFRTQKAQKLVDTLNNQPKSLTKKQKTRAKWLSKRISSNVEIKCEFCQKKSQQALLMSRKPKIEEKEEEPVVEIITKKKKKKKAKDKFAGLKLDKKPDVTTNPFKKANKLKVPNAQPKKGKVNKVISKTQKQNSLLQLASMLKNRGSATSSQGNNQLEKLLR